MIRQSRYRILSIVILALLPLRPLAAAEGYRLVVSGSPHLPFTADCRLVDARGFESWANLRDLVPQTYLLPAAAVACEIRKEGWDGLLRVRLENSAGSVAEAATHARFGEVAVRGEGPWGPRQATVTVEPLLRGPDIPSPHRPALRAPSIPIVPPLKGQTVPPLR